MEIVRGSVVVIMAKMSATKTSEVTKLSLLSLSVFQLALLKE